MKSKIVLSILLSLGLCFTSCTKKPNTSFQFNKSSYTAGDSLIIKNTSTLSNTYRWTLPFGGNVYTKDLRVKLDSNLNAGRYTYKLESFSKNRKLVDAVEQSVYVESDYKTNNLSIMFWATKPINNNTNTIEITFNYQVGYIQNSATQTIPPLFESDSISNYATFINLAKGKYTYSAFQPPQEEKLNAQNIVIRPAAPANYWTGVITVNSKNYVFKLPSQ